MILKKYLSVAAVVGAVSAQLLAQRPAYPELARAGAFAVSDGFRVDFYTADDRHGSFSWDQECHNICLLSLWAASNGNRYFIGLADEMGSRSTTIVDLDLSVGEPPAPQPAYSFPAQASRFSFSANGVLYAGTDHGLFAAARSEVARKMTAPDALIEDLDLWSDQCTLYYAIAGEARIRRHDVCSDITLPDFPYTFAAPVEALRLLSDRTIVVATASEVLLIDSAGALVRRVVPTDGQRWLSLAIRPGGALLAGAIVGLSEPALYEIDPIRGSSRRIESSLSALALPRSIAVLGEPRAAFAATSIPTFSQWTLVALAALLAMTALGRIR